MICKFIIYNWANENRIFDFAEEQKLRINEDVFDGNILVKAELFLKAGFNIMIRQLPSPPNKYQFILYVDTKGFTQR